MSTSVHTSCENPLFAAALARAAEGWAVHPLWGIVNGQCECQSGEQCPTPGKHPRLRGWQDIATTDPAQIRQWWERRPYSNIGGAAGKKSGRVVLDVDPRNGGDVSLELLEREHGPLPDTQEVVTGSGGRHLYFQDPGIPIGNTTGELGAGLDIRATGGNVVLPGSVHVSGQEYDYEFSSGPDVPLAPMPSWLVTVLTATRNGKRDHAPDCEPIGEGRRNDWLFRLACSLRAKGLSQSAIEAALQIENKARCKPPLPEEEVTRIGESGSRYEPGRGGEQEAAGREQPPWPEPRALPSGLLPVPLFREVMIPAPFRPWVTDIAERMQCPIEFPTVGALVSLAGLVGRRIGIRPKRHDDWLVLPNLWGAVIGRPGILKSPALSEVMKPLLRLEMQARAKYEEALKGWEFKKLVLKAQKDELERKVREALRNEEGIDHLSLGLSAEQEKEPLLERYIINDSTVEKLGELLNQNPNGLLLFRDELTGWLRTLDREGHEGDRAFYLEAWNGSGSYTYDRIGRGTLYINAACVSLLGGIQPGPLADYLRAAVRGGSGDDGLMPRFQLAVYPDDPGSWRNVDRWPDSEAKHRASTIFQFLATRPAGALGATLVPAIPGVVINTDEEIPCLRFAPEAQDLFDEWRNDLEQKIRSRDEHPALEAHLAKYRSLMPSLALLFHLLEVVDGTAEGAVSNRAAQVAAGWCDFLEAHARRIYQGVTQHALFAARQLAERIKAGKLPTPFTPHSVYHNGWMGLSTSEDVERAAEILEELAWVRSERIPSGQRGGRPRFHYHINPLLMEGKKTP